VEQEARLLAENIVNTLREPLMVLNEELLIITANLSFFQRFKVSAEETLGQPLYKLGNGQWDIPALRVLLNSVLSDNKTFDNYQVEHDFPAIGHRKMLLNARSIINNAVDTKLILLAMNDVSEKG
jgi:two-component system CheB/CheR fusion protein